MLRIYITVAVLLLRVTAVTSTFGVDLQVCDPAEYAQTAKERSPQKMPQLPKQWSVRIEVDMFDQGYSLDVQEFYDQINNRGAVIQWKKGVETRMIYQYSSNELIVLEFDGSGSPPTCSVETISKSAVTDYFGLSQYANGTDHVVSPDQALHFLGSGAEVPMGRLEGPDGTMADMWEECVYVETIDSTLVVDWLFSAATGWISPENIVVPIMRSAKGVMYVNNTVPQKVDRRYLYTDFRILNNDPTPFQTPPGTYCENRVSTRSLPKIPNMFSFSAETISPLTKQVNWLKQYYDFDLKLTRADYQDVPGSISLYGHNKLIRVHDYNSGVAYVIDTLIGNCSITAIGMMASDAKPLDSLNVRIRSAKEMFYLDKAKYQYAGQRVVRDVNADVFIAIRDDWPPGESTKSTWEWFFATKKWKERIGTKIDSDIPVRLHVTSSETPLNIIYNFYDYSEERPEIWKTDVSVCFTATQQHDFKINFPEATHVDTVKSDINGFKFSILQKLAAVTGVSPIRINGLEVEFPVGGLTVTGTLLDKPPIAGDVVISTPLTSLHTAVVSLNSAVQHGYFTVSVPNSNVQLTATSIA